MELRGDMEKTIDNTPCKKQGFQLNDALGYFQNIGVNVMAFDGYEQGPSTLSKYKPSDSVPGLNIGGWHDAGDFDLRIESQSGEFYILALAYEAFNVIYDVTTIDQDKRITEIHQPDGKNDILQQIEHGVLSVVGGYRFLGHN